MHDLVIKDALIYDGLGGASMHGALAVTDGRIEAVGKDVGAGREVVNADGLALMPGIIDTHTHYDAQITWDPLASPSPGLGVTTVVMGNCGFTIAPCRPADRDLVMRNLTHVEGMSLDALRGGIDWNFETFPEYLDALDRRGVGPNVACYVGHSSVRTFVMRDDATQRAARREEVSEMRRLVVEAMQAGACGFSTTRNPQHNGEAGIPMPSRLADEQELIALSGSLKDVGRGVLMMTKGELTSIEFIEQLAHEAARPYLVAALLHSNLVPDGSFEDLAQIAQARRRGNRLYGAVSACPLTFEFTLHEPYVFEGLTAWHPLLRLDEAATKQALADPAFRTAVKGELSQRGRRLFNGEWDKVFVTQAALPENAGYDGRSIDAIAQQVRKHPVDVLLDLSLDEGLDTLFSATLLNSDQEAVGRMLRDPDSIVSLSDAGAHLTFLCDAGFGLHLLGHWVREREVMPTEQAVYKLCAQPADLFGIRDRGRLAPGQWADLLLFDPARVGRGEAERVFDLPAGASRLITPGVGVHGVWINGQSVVDSRGVASDAPKAGRVLREFAP
jgi:N-acyl-D-aspartate/D-glutamate deacylase